MHAYEDSLTEDYEFKIVLPEGATNIQVELPAGLRNTDNKVDLGKFYGTLDFFGRPTVSITQKNAIYELVDDIVRVKYTFNN